MTPDQTPGLTRPGMPDLHTLAQETARGHAAIDEHIRAVAHELHSGREERRQAKAEAASETAIAPADSA